MDVHVYVCVGGFKPGLPLGYYMRACVYKYLCVYVQTFVYFLFSVLQTPFVNAFVYASMCACLAQAGATGWLGGRN